MSKETKLKVATFGEGKAFEIQTDEKPARLVAAVFWNEYRSGRLTKSDAQKYALLFASAPAREAKIKALLEVCKNLWGDLKEEHQDEIDNNHNGDDPADCSYCDDLQAAEAAIALAEKGA